MFAKIHWFNGLFKRGYCPISYFTALNLANCLSIHFPVSFMSWLTREEDQVNISCWLLSSGLQAFKQNLLVWQRNMKWKPWWSEKYVLTESLKMSASLKTCLLLQGYLKFNVNCADIFHTIYQPFLDYNFLQLQTHSHVINFPTW